MQRERTALAHRFLSRSAESLWVITGPEDQTLFRAGIPNLLPEGQTLSASLSATVCFIERGFQQKISEDVRREFMAWCDTCLNYITCQSKSISEIPQDESGGFNRIIRTEMEKASYGMVFMAREPHQAWQKRILFRERGKIIVLLGRNIHYRQVLVPVDLSETTLLVLAMLQRIYSNTRGMQFRFMHVLRGPSTTAEKRWQELMRTAGYAAAFPLQTLQATDAVHTEILKVINTGNFGMVVMGKRGVSGIKRWMLGSVSTGVLKGLNDQTLVLMD
jgi:2,4-dienoyl-CoA reductase (NADPH2)